MASSIKFNNNALRQVTEKAVADVAAKQNRELEQIRQQYAGKPVEAIKPVLQRLFSGYGGRITEPELSKWAQLISDNTRITITSNGRRA